ESLTLKGHPDLALLRKKQKRVRALPPRDAPRGVVGPMQAGDDGDPVIEKDCLQSPAVFLAEIPGLAVAFLCHNFVFYTKVLFIEPGKRTRSRGRLGSARTG